MKSTNPDYLGVYKVAVIDHKLGKTKNGFPQIVQKYSLLEYYDQKDNEWLDVSDNNWSMVGYFCLVGMKDGERIHTLNHTQICNVFDWDGCGLPFIRDDQNFAGQIVQIRVDEDTYEKAKSPVCVGWIDKEDADPNPGLRGVSDEEFDQMQSDFDDMFSSKPSKPKAAKAAKKTTKKVTKKTTPKDDPPFEPDESPEETPEPETKKESAADKKAKLAEKSKRLKEQREKEKNAAPAAPPEDKADDYGKKQAWNEIYDRRDPAAEDEQVLAAWRAAINDVSGGEGEGALDSDGWHSVVEMVLGELGEAE